MKIVTHNSSFHSDDVFAVAALLLVSPKAEVERTRDKEKIAAADYVVDCGMVYDPSRNRFDHHMPEGAGIRENGIPYASFGLVWKEFGEKIAGGKDVAEIVDAKLVQPLDAHDNGMAMADNRYEDMSDYCINDFLFSFLPRFRQSEEYLYKIFMSLTGIAKDLILREVDRAKELLEGEAKVMEAYEKSPDKRLVVLPEELPWQRAFSTKPEVLFVIYPRPDGHWSLKTVQDPGYVKRHLLPASWGGKAGEKLRRVTGVADAIFCHRALFMAAAETKEGAIKLAELALSV